jgi:hypothetical protein
MVIRTIKRLLGKSDEAKLSPEAAEMRLKALKAQLTKNKSEAKRLSSANNLAKNLSADKKAESKARLKELDVERKEIVRSMKAVAKRIPKS